MDAAVTALARRHARSSPTSARSCCYLPQDLSHARRRAAARGRRPRAAHGGRRRHRRRARRRRGSPAARAARRRRSRRRCGAPSRRTAPRWCRRPTPTTRCAPRSRLVVDGAASTAYRSSAWRCSTARPSRTPGSCTSSSTPPASRTTAPRCAPSPRACSGASLLAPARAPRPRLPPSRRHGAAGSAPGPPSAGTSVPSARWERISRRAGRRPRRGAVARAARPPRADAARRSWREERAVPDREPRPEWYEHELQRGTRPRRLRRRAARRVPRAGAGRAELARALHLGAAHRARRSSPHDTARDDAGPTPSSGPPTRSRRRSTGSPGSTRSSPRPGLDVFRRTLELELDADLGRVGRLGDGVLMGPVSLGLGPRPRPRVRLRSRRGHVPRPGPRRLAAARPRPARDRGRRWRCVPVASTTTTAAARRARGARAGRVLLYPRGDLRRTTDAHAVAFPARHGRGAHRQRASTPTTCSSSTSTGSRQVPSFAAGIARVAFPATEQEHRLRALLDHAHEGGHIATSALRDGDAALAAWSRLRARARAARPSPASTATSAASR